uniref:ATP synthase F0 subunit 8 n=1 Tax=Amblyomma tonelliae TaxID=1408822 RepID=UPI0023F21C10|nr:ATP synthase F0 subunit 8 [Amblyomma tonelliae]WEF75017.1 ATP synthase F0 subunit 8 [Amblyomma tonelliae]
MPQLFPMSWTMLSILIYFMTFILMTTIYFLKPFIHKTYKNKTSKTISLFFKW